MPLSELPLAAMLRSLGLTGVVVRGTSNCSGADALPLASVCTTFRRSPGCTAPLSSIRKVPLAATVPLPSSRPLLSRTSTVAPGSPRPPNTCRSGPTTRPLTAAGAVVSGALNWSGAEVFWAASTRRTSSASPLAWGGFNVRLKLPSAATTPLPIRAPEASRTCTVVPGSPLPVRVTPLLNCRSVGCAGASRSRDTTLPAAETLPAASVRVTCNVLPSSTAGSRVIWKVPSAPTVPLPSRLPSASRTCTVVPTSPRPLSCLPVPAMTRSVGAFGAVVSTGGVSMSGAVVLPGAEVLPAASVRVTSSAWPLVCGGLRVTSKRPSAPTVPVPIRLPAASRMLTVVPASPRPLRRRPSGETNRSIGLAGAVVSPGFGELPPLLPPPPPPPPPPIAAAAPPAPSKPRAAMAKVLVPLPATPTPAISSSSEAMSSKVKPVKASALYWACQSVPSSPTKTMSLCSPAASTTKKLPMVTFSPDLSVTIRSWPLRVTVATSPGGTGICTRPGPFRLRLPQAFWVTAAVCLSATTMLSIGAPC